MVEQGDGPGGNSGLRVRRRLSVQQAVRALAIALVLGIAMAGLQIGYDLTQLRRQIDDHVRETLALVRSAAAEAAFNLDSRVANTIVDGLFSRDIIGAVELRDDFGKTLAKRERPVVNAADKWLATIIFGDNKQYMIELEHGDGRSRRRVGELAVTVDTRSTTQEFVVRALLLLLASAASAVMLSVALIIAFQRLVTAPLESLSLAVQAVDANDPDAALIAVPPGHQDNELGSLAKAIINLLAALRDTLRYRAEAEEAMRRMATYDGLTQLPNRHLLSDRLRQSIIRANRSGKVIAVMFVDFDRFKLINDTLGHAAGDEFLRQVSRRLQTCLREADTLGRYGGDEFLVIASDLDDGFGAAKIAERMREALMAPLEIAGQNLIATMSIGIALFPRDATEEAGLLKAADTALYAVKSGGRNSFCFFSGEMNEAADSRLTLEAGLRRALEQGEFELHYQARVSGADGSLIGFEALLRWRHPDRGLLLPAAFLAVAEESGLIIPIGNWVIRTVCRQIGQWRDHFELDLPVAINLSIIQLVRGNLTQVIERECAEGGITPAALQVELTESAINRPVEEIVAALEGLRALGASVALDEFGAGYASIALLRRAPLNTLKLDHDFVASLPERRADRIVAKSVIDLAHRIGVTVVAEGIENERQADFTRALGCDALQGFHIARPQPVEGINLADWGVAARQRPAGGARRPAAVSAS